MVGAVRAAGWEKWPYARSSRGWTASAHGPVVMGPAEHDRLISFTSHLPQLASTALAATVADHLNAPEELKVAGPGLIESTRLALSSYELWRDILATNTESIEQALSAYINELESLRDNLRTRVAQEEFRRAAELAGRLRRR